MHKLSRKKIFNSDDEEIDYKKLIYASYLSDSAQKNSYEENRQILEDKLFKPAEKIISEKNSNTDPILFNISIDVLACPYISRLTSHYILLELQNDNYIFIGPKNHPFQTEETKITVDKIKSYETIIKNDDLYDIFFLKSDYKKQHKDIVELI